MVLYGLIAVKIKRAWYLGEACELKPASARIYSDLVLVPAMLGGICLGPYTADLLNARRWALPQAAHQEDEIALGVMRVVIAIQL
jgi:sodium/hydrogen antiporter